ncbi:multicopper oxidase domain-containing protein [Luteolibacter sp. Populi]|uniref:multicopper oxidase domain-containing protein n=1 Tax=Luteolibacter sp. Populi TaxID=3230487 RepID=UPI0034674212
MKLRIAIIQALAVTGSLEAQSIDLAPYISDLKRIEEHRKNSRKLEASQPPPEVSPADDDLGRLLLAYPANPIAYDKPLPPPEDPTQPAGTEEVKVRLRTYFAISKAGAQELRTLEASLAASTGPERAAIEKQLAKKKQDLIENKPRKNVLNIGPTIVAHPGDTLRFELENDLPETEHKITDENTPHDFNRTNIHFHGLHVSPSGNSDNVLLELRPQSEIHQVEVTIPEDHIPGTFWYHPHVHGSTSMQVGSGLAGALLIKAKPGTGGSNPDNLDDLLSSHGLKPANDHALLFQQIPVTKNPAPEANGVYEIESFPGHFGRNIWVDANLRKNGWRTTVNGQRLPVLRLEANSLHRLRLIHGGVHESINFTIVPVSPPGGAGSESEQLGNFQKQRSTGQAGSVRAFSSQLNTLRSILPKPAPIHYFQEVAVDGIPVADPQARKDFRRTSGASGEVIKLEPGYRSDVLVEFSYDEKGPNTFVIRDGAALNAAALAAMDPASRANAETMLKEGQLSVNETLQFENEADLDEPFFRPPAEIALIEVIKGPAAAATPPENQKYATLRQPAATPREEDAATLREFTLTPGAPASINGLPYSAAREPMQLPLNRLEKWVLKNTGHPFHIHVNPFYDPVEKVWRDTFRAIKLADGTDESNRGFLIQQKDYLGKFVMHCHILDHEDTGMMAGVEVVNTPYEPGSLVNLNYRDEPDSPWKVPVLTLKKQDGTDFILGEEFKDGNALSVVLVLLESKDCPACSAQVAAFDAFKTELDQLKCRVVFVEPNAPREAGGVFPYLFDQDLSAHAALKAVRRFPGGMSPLHGTYVIVQRNNELRIAWRASGDRPYMRIKEELMREIRTLSRP